MSEEQKYHLEAVGLEKRLCAGLKAKEPDSNITVRLWPSHIYTIQMIKPQKEHCPKHYQLRENYQGRFTLIKE